MLTECILYLSRIVLWDRVHACVVVIVLSLAICSLRQRINLVFHHQGWNVPGFPLLWMRTWTLISTIAYACLSAVRKMGFSIWYFYLYGWHYKWGSFFYKLCILLLVKGHTVSPCLWFVLRRSLSFHPLIQCVLCHLKLLIIIFHLQLIFFKTWFWCSQISQLIFFVISIVSFRATWVLGKSWWWLQTSLNFWII